LTIILQFSEEEFRKF